MISNTVQVSHISPISQEKDINYLLNKTNKLSRRQRSQFNLAFDLCMRYLKVCPSQKWVANHVGYKQRGNANRAFRVLREEGLLDVQNMGKYPGIPYKNKTCLIFLPDWFTPELCAQYKAHLRSLKDQFTCKFVETRRKFVDFTNSITSTLKEKATHIKSSLSSKHFLFKNILNQDSKVTSSKKEDMVAVVNIPNSNNEFIKYIPKGVGWEDQFKDEIKLEHKDEEAFQRFKDAIEEAQVNKKSLLKERISIDLLPEENKPTILANWKERSTAETMRWLLQSGELMKEDRQLFDMLYKR